MMTRPHALPPLAAPVMTVRDYARAAGLTMAEVMEECATGRLDHVVQAGRRLIVGVRPGATRSPRSRRG